VEKIGILLTFDAQIDNYTSWTCGTRLVPAIPQDDKYIYFHLVSLEESNNLSHSISMNQFLGGRSIRNCWIAISTAKTGEIECFLSTLEIFTKPSL
jgi:hypothetical protein